MTTILTTLQKKKKMDLITLGRIKICNSTKIGQILCIQNKIIKDLMNAFFN
jgi:hypothetical protein